MVRASSSTTAVPVSEGPQFAYQAGIVRVVSGMRRQAKTAIHHVLCS